MANQAAQMARGENWATQTVPLEGGLVLDRDDILQALQMPGSATNLINFEPSLYGGYHRILGYTKFDSAQMPHGTSQIYGTIVNSIDSSVIAMQGGDTYQSTGSGWTKINGADNHSAMGNVNWTFYSWATDRFAWVDGDPNAHPVRIESGGTYTVLTNAPKGQKFIQEFLGYLWMTSGNSTLTFSAPDNDNDYNAIDGAGTINVGFNIQGLGVWRGALYVFGERRIAQITGTSAADWVVTLLTDDIGMTGAYSLQEVNGDLIFLSSDGFRTISGTARIFDRELGVISRNINSLIVGNAVSNLISVVIKTKSQYRIFQSTSSTVPGSAMGFIGALKQQSNGSTAWEWSQTQGIALSCASSGLYNNVEMVIHAGYDGYVYQQEKGTDFSGTAINAVFQTPYLVFNDPAIRKIIYKLWLDIFASGANTINVGVVYDHNESYNPPNQTVSFGGGGGVWDGVGTTWDNVLINWDTSSPDSKVKSNIIGSGFDAAFVLSSSGGPDYSIKGMTIQYSEAARR